MLNHNEMIKMLCAEVGVEIWASVNDDRTYFHMRRLPEDHPDVILGRKAAALANHRAGVTLMNCLTHRHTRRMHECLLVPTTDVISNPSLTCGAP